VPSRSTGACRTSPERGDSGPRVDLRHQLGTRAIHDGVRGRDDELLRAHVGLEREPATLGDVASVDVAPQIPAPQGRVASE
jgi:hypothetical protein